MEALQSLNWVNLAITVFFALLGMTCHYVKKWLRGETHNTLTEYLFANGTWRNTVQATLAVLGTVLTMFVTGQIPDSIQGLVTVFTIGYAFDSALNRDSPAPAAEKWSN